MYSRLLGDAGEALPIEVMRARQISRPQCRAEAVRQLGEIAVGDERIAQRLLLLRERKQSGLPNDSRLNPAGDGVVGRQGGFAGHGVRKGRDWSQTPQDSHIGCGLRVGPGAPIIRTRRLIPYPSLFMAPFLLNLPVLPVVERSSNKSQAIAVGPNWAAGIRGLRSALAPAILAHTTSSWDPPRRGVQGMAVDCDCLKWAETAPTEIAL